MTQQQNGYLLGLGSNIDPFDNFGQIINLLLNHFEKISLSRVLHIPPVGMNSQHHFLNAVAFIETAMPQGELKNICNQIEITLGRDRDDPDSKHKDRPADLDILACLRFPDDAKRTANSITDEYFLYPLIDELKAYITVEPCEIAIQKGSHVESGPLSFGETATTIYRYGDTR
jgi:2-amino-4-hydroxy-6-hydroxymethyldihydropteridine diphosphokinase